MSTTAASTSYFLDGTATGEETLRDAVHRILDAVTSADRRGPFPAATPDQLRAAIEAIDPLPDDGVPLRQVLAEVGPAVLAQGARTTDPWCAAHLHSPTLLTAAATELAIGVTNQSMDSFDQAPAATYTEDHLVRVLAGLFGLPGQAGGVLTAGGTSSNLLGLLLARDRTAGGPNVAGLPPDASRWRVLASAAAHVSVRQACSVLGLGRNAVVPVDADDGGRMRLDALDRTLDETRRAGDVPVAIVGTAGTTDTGGIDPLDALADRAAEDGVWFHVDAALGAGLVLSERLRPLLAGIERADSITADLHKLWWQPIGASALLVRDIDTLHGFREPADYLNRGEDADVLDLVDRSLDTSRRFDALKALVSLRATGRRRLAGFVEHLTDLAAEAGKLVDNHPELELVAPPQTITVLFRCRPAWPGGPADDDWPAHGHAGAAPRRASPGGHGNADDAVLDRLNVDVQRALLAAGRAVVGRTRLDGRVVLKLTLVNPLATVDDIAALLELIAQTAAELPPSDSAPGSQDAAGQEATVRDGASERIDSR